MISILARRPRGRTRLAVASAGALCAALALAACSSSGSGSSGSSPSSAAAAAGSTTGTSAAASSGAATGSPYVIGLTTAETGLLATYDGSVVDGAKIAATEFNKQGGILGHPITFTSVDSKSVIADEGPAATKVLNNGAQALIVSSGVAFGGPAAIVANAHKKISFVAEGDLSYGVSSIGPYAYNIANVSPLMGTGIAQWAYGKGYRKLELYVDTTYSNNPEECKYTAAAFKALGGTVVGEQDFKNSDPSMTTQVNNIRNQAVKPDLVELCSSPPGGVTALRDLRAQLQTPVVADESMDGNYWIGGIPTLSNFYLSAYTSLYGDDPVAKVNDINAGIKQLTGKAPQTGLGSYGYCMVQALRLAAQKANSIDPDKMRAALDAFNGEPLVCGNTTYTSQQHYSTDRLVRIVQVQNGKFSYDSGVTVKTLPTGVGS